MRVLIAHHTHRGTLSGGVRAIIAGDSSLLSSSVQLGGAVTCAKCILFLGMGELSGWCRASLIIQLAPDGDSTAVVSRRKSRARASGCSCLCPRQAGTSLVCSRTPAGLESRSRSPRARVLYLTSRANLPT